MTRHFRICFFTFTLLLLPSAFSKHVFGSVKLEAESPTQYVGKFSFSPRAQGDVIASVESKDVDFFHNKNADHQLHIALYNDEAWEKYQSLNSEDFSLVKCINLISIATWKHRIKMETESDSLVRFTMDDVFEQKDSSQYMFAVFFDCVPDPNPPLLKYNVTFLNGGSHLPADEDGMIALHCILLSSSVIFVFVTLLLLVHQYRWSGQIHLVGILLLLAMILQIGSDVAELMHLIVFEADGHGLRLRYVWFPADFFSEAFLIYA